MQLTLTVQHFLSDFCHQIPSRSFCRQGQCVPLCQRCTGIYLGFAIVAGYWRARGAHLRVLPTWPAVAFLACTTVLLTLNVTGTIAPQAAGWDRFVTGALTGSGVAMVASPLAFGELDFGRAPATAARLKEVAILGFATIFAAVPASLAIRYAIAPASIVLAGLVGGAFVCLWAALVRGIGGAIGSIPPRRQLAAGIAVVLTVVQFIFMRFVRQS